MITRKVFYTARSLSIFAAVTSVQDILPDTGFPRVLAASSSSALSGRHVSQRLFSLYLLPGHSVRRLYFEDIYSRILPAYRLHDSSPPSSISVTVMREAEAGIVEERGCLQPDARRYGARRDDICAGARYELEAIYAEPVMPTALSVAHFRRKWIAPIIYSQRYRYFHVMSFAEGLLLFCADAQPASPAFSLRRRVSMTPACRLSSAPCLIFPSSSSGFRLYHISRRKCDFDAACFSSSLFSDYFHVFLLRRLFQTAYCTDADVSVSSLSQLQSFCHMKSSAESACCKEI